jgi:integrase/recombinase XerD
MPIKRAMQAVNRNHAIDRKGPCGGPLAPHMDGFVARLLGEGYAPKTIRYKCGLVGNLSDWLKRRDASLADVDEAQLRRYLANRSRRLRVRHGDLPTLQQLLEHLRDLGRIPRLPQKVDRTALGKLMQNYESFLSSERALSSSTLLNYLPTVRRFLMERFKGQIPSVERIQPTDLHRFILREGQRLSRRRTQLTITALRSFLRFLLQRGAIKTDLAASLPAVANWRLWHLPKSIPPDQVKRLLDCCNRMTPAGKRDYAILLLLARLGLRGGEVRHLTLGDLDWERGEITVCGKSQRRERLPLPKDVGKAVADYLRYARPICSTRVLFVRRHAPLRGLGNSGVSCVVARALKRAGLNPDLKGAHLLRHSLATSMLRRGATLGEIGQLLRHAHPITTQIYAKVDIKALRGISLPWMGGVS